MVSRENRLTLVFVLVALPCAYATQYALEPAGVGGGTAFGVAFFVLLGVGVGLPQFLLSRLGGAAE